MFSSQNVFSAKDVLPNSNLCDTWDSQPYSQINSYSQNSQMSSLDLFSQQKGSNQAKFDQIQRSQSQTTDEEPSNYYSKYVNNPPLFHGSFNRKNSQTNPIKDMLLEEQKRNISMREERDLLQTIVNLLKDYTKEVNSAFQNFKDYMEKSFQETTKTVIDGVKDFDNTFKTLKEELLITIDKTEKESNEKQELQKNILEQTGTIKVLESRIEILEKQLCEVKDKETEHADLKMKCYQLEQKYLEGVKNWDYGLQTSFLGNTPPLSQHLNPLCNYLVPPLHQEGSILDNPGTMSGNYLHPNEVPLLASSYGLEFWDPARQQSQETVQGYNYNPQLMNSFQIDSNLNPPFYAMTSNVLPSTSNCMYPSRNGSTSDCREASQVIRRNNTTHAQDKRKEFDEKSTSHQHGNLQKSGSSAESSIIVTRRSTKRPKQSPMAMVKPQIRRNDYLILQNNDELSDIFICSVKEGSGDKHRNQNTTKSEISSKEEWQRSLNKIKVNGNELVKIPNPPNGQKSRERYQCDKAMDSNITERTISMERMLTDDKVRQEVSKENKCFRRKESVRRKRSLVSMLGTSSDDLEVQEIANSIKAQQRSLVKRIKSLS